MVHVVILLDAASMLHVAILLVMVILLLDAIPTLHVAILLGVGT